MTRGAAVPWTRRAAAVVALLAYAGALVVLLVVLVDDLLALLAAWAAIIIFGVAAWIGITRRGVGRAVGTLVAVAALAGAVVVLLYAHAIVEVVTVPVLVGLATLAAHHALATDRRSRRAGAPPGVRRAPGRHPVLLMNPRSGGGKVARFHLEDEARARGVEPVVLGPGDDLEHLARAAVRRGADVIGMAGGDGSQALVAGIASDHDLPFVCIPAGTRNHLALDLGVDRGDVVGALDAFVDGYERRVDLARAAGRVFVNNVSLGVYAKVVQSDAYRDDKLGTVATMLPDLLGPDREPFDLRFDGPADGAHDHADLVLVSNNRYQLERIGGFGGRARLDEGVLGIVTIDVRTAGQVAELMALQSAGAISRFSGWRSWTATTFEVRSSVPIAAGVDGEAVVEPSPLRFEIVPGALRVRVASHHPGRSPTADALALGPASLGGLLRIATGRDRVPAASAGDPAVDLGR